jgi:uncharacterized SAM-binding protein YcdF (DUF218 family)
MTTKRATKIIWNYMCMRQKPKKADAIIVFGSHDIRFAERAADLYHQQLAPIIISGGLGRLTKNKFKKTEAETLAEIIVKSDVPRSAVYLEERATNTGENCQFTKALIEKEGLNVQTAIIVQKPYMERRTFATVKKQWPELSFTVTSPNISMRRYPNANISKQAMINTMLGDLQRISEYPEHGFQIYQKIPRRVWKAFNYLRSKGYTDQFIKSSQ